MVEKWWLHYDEQPNDDVVSSESGVGITLGAHSEIETSGSRYPGNRKNLRSVEDNNERASCSNAVVLHWVIIKIWKEEVLPEE